MGTVKDVGYVIGYPLSKDRIDVISFLNDNLILVSQNDSDEKIISSMFDSFAAKPELFDKYTKWLYKKYGNFSNAVGDAAYLGTPDASSGGFGFNMGSLTSLLGSAANIFASIKGSDAALDAAKAQANAANAAANAAANTNATNLEIAKLQLQAAMQGTGKGSNTALYVILGIVGVGIVGTMIYLVSRKK